MVCGDGEELLAPRGEQCSLLAGVGRGRWPAYMAALMRCLSLESSRARALARRKEECQKTRERSNKRPKRSAGGDGESQRPGRIVWGREKKENNSKEVKSLHDTNTHRGTQEDVTWERAKKGRRKRGVQREVVKRRGACEVGEAGGGRRRRRMRNEGTVRDGRIGRWDGW